MIVSTLVVITEAVSMFHPQVETRILGMEHTKAHQWRIHLMECQPVVDIIVRGERCHRKVRHNVQLCLARLDKKYSAQADSFIAKVGVEYVPQNRHKIVSIGSGGGLDLENLSRFALRDEEVAQQPKFGRR